MGAELFRAGSTLDISLISGVTLPATPENGWLEDVFPFGNIHV